MGYPLSLPMGYATHIDAQLVLSWQWHRRPNTTLQQHSLLSQAGWGELNTTFFKKTAP
jgi:hypothetical protein